MAYNLFLSHSWRYSDAYDKLESLLRSHQRFEFKNYSIPRDDPIHNAANSAALEAAIRNKISYAYAVIVLAGVYSTYSKWIRIEIKLAKAMGKPIIAVQPFGSERTSQFVAENADRIVGWRASSVVDAIRELSR